MEKRIIENKSVSLYQELKEAYNYRSLIWDMAARELKIRYAQTIFGLFWAFMKPLAYLGIYTFFFTIMMPIESLDAPYALIALIGVMSWMLFMDVVNSSGEAIVMDAPILKENAIPLLVPILYRSLLGLVEFSISLIIFLLIQLYLGHPMQWTIIFIPLVLLVNVLIGLSISIWTNVLGVKIRDFYHFIQTFVSFGFWLTPVFYTPELVPEKFRFLMYFNPMAGVIEWYRYLMLGLEMPSVYYMIGILGSLIILLAGLFRFKNERKGIVDYL